MLAIGGLVALCKTEIDNVNCALGLVCASNQKVIRFDIPVDDSLLVDHLDPLDHLDRDVENCADVKLSSALLEQVLEGLAEHVHYHNVIHFTIFSFFISNEV